jgi:quercetin dioxygenase-like cupin family protein
MNGFDWERRSLLFSLGITGIGEALQKTIAAAQQTAQRGNVLGANEGEHLVHFRDGGNIYIKFGSRTGSDHLAMGTQQVKRGTGIPTHRHFEMEEAFYILEGRGTCTLDDVPHTFEQGATIFIPRKRWHGFANPDREMLLLWVVSPAGLDDFFRETCNPPGGAAKQLTREQIVAIARKYGTEFR